MALRLVTDDDDRDDRDRDRERADRDGPAAGPVAPPCPPPAEQTVAYAGRLAFVDHDEFVSLVEGAGSRFVPRPGPHTHVLVVGQRDWALRADGTLPPALGRPGPDTMVVSEERFLAVLGVEPEDRVDPQLYTAATLAEILGVSRARLGAWVRAGLVRPAKVERGVQWFGFRQASVAKLLWDLVGGAAEGGGSGGGGGAGVTLAEVRRSLQRLRAWMPDVEQPLEQLAVIERCGRLLVRLEQGLAEPDGQFHFDFTGEPDPEPLTDGGGGGPSDCTAGGAMSIGPRTAEQWYARAAEQAAGGYLEEAAESYGQGLLKGGPEARACYELGHVLARLGRRWQAVERYRQAAELDPRMADAWNNLGVLLCEGGQREEGCTAFRRALAATGDLAGGGDARVHYNLADALEELGRPAEARPHWAAYARQDPLSEWGRYARARLAQGQPA